MLVYLVRTYEAENKLPKHYCRRSLTLGRCCIMEPWIAASSSLLGYRHVGMGSGIRFRYVVRILTALQKYRDRAGAEADERHRLTRVE
jgi:hypothetical protein